MLSYKGSIASLMRCTILELGSVPSVSAIPLNDASGTIVYSRSARIINGATLLAWYTPITPDPFRPFSLRMWMAMMWSWIFLLSFSGMPHFLHCSGASSIRRPMNSDRRAATLFLR